MKLEDVRIENFHSIKSERLSDCGGFNVLIGKNNAGKSNVLSAIQCFFDSISDGAVVNISPTAGSVIDFFERNSTAPIKLALTFSLELAERDALIRSIVMDSPQMKNAADGLDPALRLQATVNIVSDPNKFSYMSDLSLVGTEFNPRFELALMKIEKDAAIELYNQSTRTKLLTEELDVLSALSSRVDSDDFSQMKNSLSGSERGLPVQFYFERFLNVSSRERNLVLS